MALTGIATTLHASFEEVKKINIRLNNDLEEECILIRIIEKKVREDGELVVLIWLINNYKTDIFLEETPSLLSLSGNVKGYNCRFDSEVFLPRNYYSFKRLNRAGRLKNGQLFTGSSSIMPEEESISLGPYTELLKLLTKNFDKKHQLNHQSLGRDLLELVGYPVDDSQELDISNIQKTIEKHEEANEHENDLLCTIVGMLQIQIDESGRIELEQLSRQVLDLCKIKMIVSPRGYFCEEYTKFSGRFETEIQLIELIEQEPTADSFVAAR